jgi:hypothetical protein
VVDLRQGLRCHTRSRNVAAGVGVHRRIGQVYFAPDEKVLAPANGAVHYLFYVRREAVISRHADGQAFEYDAGDLFPIGAVVGQRP